MRFILALLATVLMAGPSAAQTVDPLAELLEDRAAPEPTLEDMRLSLQQLDAILTELRQQLVSTGQVAPGVPFDAPTLERLNAVEARVRVLTGEVERLQFDVQRMAEDGGRRISDIEFRLSELEGAEGAAPLLATPLGGGMTESSAVGGGASAPAVAVSEQSAFDRAFAALEAEDYPAAAAGFESFLASFPGGPLAAEARYGLGRALSGQGQDREAALNYLNAYSAEPNGEIAAVALASLADALGRLGQATEACLTYDEALARFSNEGDAYTARIEAAREGLGCN